MKSRGVSAAIVVILVALPLALLAAAWLNRSDTVDGITIRREAVLTEATARTVTDSRPAALRFTWEPGIELYAPAWNGTITRLYAERGTTLRPGDPVVAIDGVDRIAIPADGPFYRAIRSGVTGDDALALHRFLVSLDLLPESYVEDPIADFNTQTAVRELEEMLGVAPTTGIFDTAYAIWLPGEEFVVGELMLTQGAPAPGPGQPIARARARLQSAIAAAANPVEPLTLQPGVEYVAILGDLQVPIDPSTLAADATFFEQIIDAVPPDAEQTNVTVQRREPLNAVAVPSAAVMTNSSGALCVWVPEGTAFAARPVQLGGARAGVTNVTSGIAAGEQVLANPAEVLDDPQCPSN